MRLSDEFLSYLACPKCKGDLEYRYENAGAEHCFICHSCKLLFPVVDGIPNFIIEEAQPVTGKVNG